VPLGFDKLGSEVSDLLLVPVGRTRLQGQVDGLLNLEFVAVSNLFETISG